MSKLSVDGRFDSYTATVGAGVPVRPTANPALQTIDSAQNPSFGSLLFSQADSNLYVGSGSSVGWTKTGNPMIPPTPIDDPVVTVTANYAALPNSRVLQAGSNISIANAGPGQPVIVSLNPTDTPIPPILMAVDDSTDFINSRQVVAGSGITVVDGGAGGNFTVSITLTNKFVTAVTDAALPNSSRLIGGTNISVVDNGPSSTMVVSLTGNVGNGDPPFITWEADPDTGLLNSQILTPGSSNITIVNSGPLPNGSCEVSLSSDITVNSATVLDNIIINDFAQVYQLQFYPSNPLGGNSGFMQTFTDAISQTVTVDPSNILGGGPIPISVLWSKIGCIVCMLWDALGIIDIPNPGSYTSLTCTAPAISLPYNVDQVQITASPVAHTGYILEVENYTPTNPTYLGAYFTLPITFSTPFTIEITFINPLVGNTDYTWEFEAGSMSYIGNTN